MEKSQAESFVCGVGPAESTGKPRSRYCPGGSLPLVSLGWRRPRNPREKNPSLIVSPPALLSLCSYCALVYHAQTFIRLSVRVARWTLPLLLFSGRRDLAGCAYHFLSARHRDFVAPPGNGQSHPCSRCRPGYHVAQRATDSHHDRPSRQYIAQRLLRGRDVQALQRNLKRAPSTPPQIASLMSPALTV